MKLSFYRLLHFVPVNGPFSKLRKTGNWQFATDTLIMIIEAQRQDFFMGVLRHHSFLYKAQNNCTDKYLRMNKHLFIF